MSHRFFATIRHNDDGSVSASAHHTYYSPSRVDDEHVLQWVDCQSYEEAAELIAEKARRRGFRWDQIEWDEEAAG